MGYIRLIEVGSFQTDRSAPATDAIKDDFCAAYGPVLGWMYRPSTSVGARSVGRDPPDRPTQVWQRFLWGSTCGNWSGPGSRGSAPKLSISPGPLRLGWGVLQFPHTPTQATHHPSNTSHASHLSIQRSLTYVPRLAAMVTHLPIEPERHAKKAPLERSRYHCIILAGGQGPGLRTRGCSPCEAGVMRG
jgi:hypothetical protein